MPIWLLSNRETNTFKLLQIILVGQPELGELLDSHELRQLGQRITLSCHLRPLSAKEMRQYIEHRLHIAGSKPAVQFTNAAFRAIYKYSGGTPRLVNIICDRSLLTAFCRDQKNINTSVVRAAARELTGRAEIKQLHRDNRIKLALSMMPEDEARAELARDVEEMQAMLDTFLDFARLDATEDTEPSDPVALLVQFLTGSKKC